MKEKVRWLYLGVMLTLFIPRLAASALVNEGNLLLNHEVLNSGTSLSAYPHWNLDPESAVLKQAVSAFETAVRFDPHNFTAKWGYLRVALALGAKDRLVQTPPMDTPSLFENPLYFLDTLAAYSRVGDDKRVMALYALYEQHPFRANISLTDNVAVAYLNMARQSLAAGDLEESLLALYQVIKLKPSDLYVHYQLWRYAVQIGNQSEAAMHLKQLRYFPADAVILTDERLLEKVFEIFPELLADNVWGSERGQNLMRYWVWQYPALPALDSLLQRLIVVFPDQVEWSMLQGERYQRLGRLDLAAQYYQQVLARQPNHVLAQWQLAQLASSPQSRLMAESQQDQETVARLLGIPADRMKLGSDLVQWGTFSGKDIHVEGGQLGWQFVSGKDLLEEDDSLRILNLWWPAVDETSGYIPYAEDVGQAHAVPASWMMVSVWYKAEGDATRNGLLVVGNANRNDRLPFFTHTFLPDTFDHWIKLIVVGRTPPESLLWFSLLRNRSAASLWFRDLTMRPIQLSETPRHCSDSPCVYFSPPLER